MTLFNDLTVIDSVITLSYLILSTRIWISTERGSTTPGFFINLNIEKAIVGSIIFIIGLNKQIDLQTSAIAIAKETIRSLSIPKGIASIRLIATLGILTFSFGLAYYLISRRKRFAALNRAILALGFVLFFLGLRSSAIVSSISSEHLSKTHWSYLELINTCVCHAIICYTTPTNQKRKDKRKGL